MYVYRALCWFACALVPTATSEPALALQNSRLLVTSHHGHSFVIAIEGRKGTRNYAADDTGETTEVRHQRRKAPNGRGEN